MKSFLLTFLFLLSIPVFEAQCVINCSISATDEQTYAGCDGTVTLTSIGGGGNQFIYILIDNSTGLEVNRDTSILQPYTFTGVCAGTYAYIIQDINGVACCYSQSCSAGPPCSGSGSGGTATVGSAAATLNVYCEVNYDWPVCPGETPPVDGFVTGGMADYDFMFDGGGGNSGWITTSNNYESWTLPTDYAYVDVVVVDNNGEWGSGQCYAIPPDEIMVSSSHNDNSCLGMCDGDIDLIITGGSGDYFIDWGDSDHYVPDNTTSAMNLCAGVYIVAVYDNQECSFTGYDTITIEPSQTPVVRTDSIIACNSFTWLDGYTYTANEHNYDKNYYYGCDSVITLYLTIVNQYTVTDTHISCGAFTWIDGNTYTSSNNTAVHTFTTSKGCDSIVTLDLTINNPSSGTDMITACDSYTWINGVTYTSSNNTAIHTLTNVAGCDSTVTLDLTINYGTTGDTTAVVCDSFDWYGNIYTASGDYTHLLTNITGCDSLVTLHLTINNSSSGTDMITACDSYTWIDGVTYTSSNNTATYALSNAAGCDSIVTLDLTIKYSNSGDTTALACGSFDWYGTTYTASGDYTYLLTNTNGCDSLVTLHLTINNSSSGTDVINACDSYTWIDGNTYTSSNNTATYTLTNSMGCDSVVSLDLIINTVDISVIDNSPTLTANATGATYQWVDCDNGNSPIPGEIAASFTAISNGNYAVEVTQNGCTTMSGCYSVMNVSDGSLILNGINVYPNPTDGLVIVDIEGKAEVYSVIVTNQLGQVVTRLNATDKARLEVDLTNEPTGVYFLKFELHNGEGVAYKLMKH